MNGKTTYAPRIRAAYQKLEGLRDDLYLQVETSTGEKYTLEARPADWYDGIDRLMTGSLVLTDTPGNVGCEEYPKTINGKIALVARGRCTFAKKMELAKAAGAQSVLLYDELISKIPFDRQNRTGLTRSKGTNTRSQADALIPGTSSIPVEKGITIMAPSPVKTGPKPEINGVMVNRMNGTFAKQVLEEGGTVKVLGVDRFEFKDGIDLFIENKELKNMLLEMEIYSFTQRMSKDDLADPIIATLKKDRKAFEKAVKAKDYGEIRKTYQEWQSHLDPLGKFELAEEQ